MTTWNDTTGGDYGQWTPTIYEDSSDISSTDSIKNWKIRDVVEPVSSWPALMPPSLEDLKKVLTACIVCGEAGFVLCGTCQSAVLEARKNMLQGMMYDLMEMEGKDDMKLHQGFTNTGGLTHAVVLIKRGEYMKRALCGVRVIETTARYFAKADSQCARCKNSAAKSA